MRKLLLILLLSLFLVPVVFADAIIIRTNITIRLEGIQEGNDTNYKLLIQTEENNFTWEGNFSDSVDINERRDVAMIRDLNCEETDIFKFINNTLNNYQRGCDGKDCKDAWIERNQSYTNVVANKASCEEDRSTLKDSLNGTSVDVFDLKNENSNLSAQLTIREGQVSNLNTENKSLESKFNYALIGIAVVGLGAYFQAEWLYNFKTNRGKAKIRESKNIPHLTETKSNPTTDAIIEEYNRRKKEEGNG